MNLRNKLLEKGIDTFKWASFHHTFTPRVIEVETTKACNLRCPGCRRNYKEGCIASEPGEKHLTTDNLWRILATTNCSLLRFEGDGEPLCNPHFKELVAFLNKFGIRSMMTSNGTLLDESWIKFLEENGMIRIHVSFDGTTKDIYEKVKVGGDFDKTLYNCKLVGRSKIQLFMSIVLFNDQLVEELPKYIEQAKSVDATGIHFMKMQRDTLEFGAPPHIDNSTIENFKKLGKKAGLVMVGSSSDTPTFKRCYDPFINPFVLLNNDVYACTYMANLRRSEVYMDKVFPVPYQNYKMGNLQENWMNDIWKNNKYKELRKFLSDTKVPNGWVVEPEELLRVKTESIDGGGFSFCASCLCQWGESGL